MQISEHYKKIWSILFTAILVIAAVLGLKLISTAGHKNDTLPATITVNGKGEIKATPDVSKFMVTIEETAKDQTGALSASSLKVNAVIDELRKLGIAEKDIKTEYTNVNPKYEYQAPKMDMIGIYPQTGSNQVITGYTSSHTLSVKVRDLQKVSDVQKIFAAQKAQNVSGPDLAIDDVDAIKLDARAKAIDDATEQAKVLARQLHVRLGDVVSFNESGDGAYPVYMSARANMAMDVAGKAAPEATVATGEQTITSNVSITYKIK